MHFLDTHLFNEESHDCVLYIKNCPVGRAPHESEFCSGNSSLVLLALLRFHFVCVFKWHGLLSLMGILQSAAVFLMHFI